MQKSKLVKLEPAPDEFVGNTDKTKMRSSGKIKRFSPIENNSNIKSGENSLKNSKLSNADSPKKNLGLAHDQPLVISTKKPKLRASGLETEPRPRPKKNSVLLAKVGDDLDLTKEPVKNEADTENPRISPVKKKSNRLDISIPVGSISEKNIENLSDSNSAEENNKQTSQKLQKTNVFENGKGVISSNRLDKKISGNISGMNPKKIFIDSEEELKKRESSDEDEFDTPPPTIKPTKKQNNQSTINLTTAAKNGGKPLAEP